MFVWLELQMFLEKREQLLECCMHQFRDHVEPSELEAIQVCLLVYLTLEYLELSSYSLSIHLTLFQHCWYAE